MAKNIDELLLHIRGMRGATYGVGASREEIHRAEEILGGIFPRSFKRYLETLGWLTIGPHEVFGLGRDTPRHLCLVDITLSERLEFVPPIPKALVPFYNDGSGNHYCFNPSISGENDSCIVFWDHELPADQVPSEVAESFTAWLEHIIAA